MRGRFWLWTSLGTASSVLVAVSGTRLLGTPATPWWFEPHPPAPRLLFYIGLVLLCVSWVGLGRTLRPGGGRGLWLAGVLWCLPLALGPVLFSRDVYSYLAQGEILHLGLNPYHAAPAILASHGHAHLLGTVSPFWRHTTAPYGPLFLGLVAPIAAATSTHLVAGVLLARLLDLVGIALVAVLVPRIARALGADPLRAGRLAAISPLVLLQLVAAGHNDALMVGLMVAGVALAVVHRRPFAAIAVCAVAAGIKVPALAAGAFIAVAFARERWEAGDRDGALRLLAGGAAITVAVLAVVSIATGVDATWLTSGVFSTPQKVHLAITPGTAVGYTLASLLHDLGAGVSTRSLENAFNAVTALATVGCGLVLLARVRREGLVLYLGAFLAVAAFGGPAAWPWYFVWGFALLAACPGPQRSWALTAALALPVLLVKPDGILALSVTASPAVLAVYIVLAVVAWRAFRGRQRRGPAPTGLAPSGPAVSRPTVEPLA